MDLGQDLGGQPSPGDVAAGAPTAPAAAPPAAGVAATGAQSTLLDVVGVLSQSSYTTGATSPSTSSLLVERLVFLPTRTRHRIAPNGSPHELDVPDPRHGNGHDSGPGPGARPPGRPGSRPTR